MTGFHKAPIYEGFRRSQNYHNIYMGKVMFQALTLIRLIVESLGLSPNCFDASLVDEPSALLRLSYIDAICSDVDAGVYACGAHSDYGIFSTCTYFVKLK